ncbi:MAG: hypothetical protein B6I18_07380 [Bacteroidetes bacterium 4572_112]|nr:MAG: hypothetical protein B6I18_07380 [Bacteroidetes bacterium 4572_112]
MQLNKKIDLVLSGGGARGAIHVGILQAFDDYKIEINAISGTSAGAIIGALYCAGVKPIVIQEIMVTKSYKDLFHFSLHKKGFMDMSKLAIVLKEFIKDDSFESLKIPMHVCASNVDAGGFRIFNSGTLFDKVAASASVPIVFEPILIDGEHYIDGGLFNNLPVDPFVGGGNLIIGSHVNNYTFKGELNVLSITDRIISLVIKENVKKSGAKCDYLLNPFVEGNDSLFNLKNSEKLFDVGYEAAEELINTELIRLKVKP